MNPPLARKMVIITFAASLGTLLCSGSSTLASPHMRPQATLKATWTPNAALGAALGPQVMVAGYKMRLPVGYTADLKKAQATGPFKFRLFSLHKANDIGPSMYVMAVSLPPKAATADASDARGTAEKLFNGDGFTNQKRVGLVKTQPQTGRINGLQAARQYFQDTGADGHKRQGFHYGVVDGARRLLIVGVDDEPRSKTSLPVAEAAVLTLRR